MLSRALFAGGLLLLAVFSVSAQDKNAVSPAAPSGDNAEPAIGEILPALKDRAVVLNIAARIIEQNKDVWNSENSRVTIPGRPVGLKLVGDNVVVVVQFTTFLRRNGTRFLVAQGQIWLNVPEEGIRYLTTMQTIPIQFGEEIFFFPLGSSSSPDDSKIEIRLVLEPYEDADAE